MKQRSHAFQIVSLAMMAAIVCAVTFLRFPLLGSKVHFANAMCLLSGLLFGPVPGGLAAGLGSALYDGLYGGYDFVQCLITFASKFVMAWLCAVLAKPQKEGLRRRIVPACLAGAFSYVALYMLKTYVYQRFVYAYPLPTVWAAMLSKLPAPVINAAAAVIAAPILYAAVAPALQKAGLLEKLRGDQRSPGAGLL